MRLIINSKDKLNTTFGYDHLVNSNTSSNFIYRINYPIEYRGFFINKLIIPHAWYYIIPSKNNDTLDIIDSLGAPYTIILEPGSYSSSDLVAVLQVKLNALASTDTFTVTISPINGKITILNNIGNWTIKFSTSQIYKVLGFSNVDVSGAPTYTSSSIINTSDACIYLNSRVISESINTKSSSGTSIVETLPVNVSFGGYIIYEPTRKLYARSSQTLTISDIDFYFTDKDGNVLDFNNVECIIDLTLFDSTFELNQH